MKLKIETPKNSFSIDITSVNEVEKYLEKIMKQDNCKKCRFKIEGEADLVPADQIVLFG